MWGADPKEKAELKRIAEQEGLSMSATSLAFWRAGMPLKLHERQAGLLQPILEQVITKITRADNNRISFLQVRSFYATEQTRALVVNILGRMPGVTPEVLDDILDHSAEAARAKIMRQSPEFVEFMKQWQNQEETEDNK